MTKHIFISYAKKDTKPLATSLYAALRAVDGLTAWMDETLETGRSWARQIQREIDRADFVLVLLSPDVNREETPDQPQSFVLNEIHYSQQERKTIILIMAQRTSVPVELAGAQYLDVTRDPDGGLARIVEEICRRAGVESPKQRQEREAQAAAAGQAEADRAAKAEAERAAKAEVDRKAKEEAARRRAEQREAARKTQQEQDRRKAIQKGVEQRKADANVSLSDAAAPARDADYDPYAIYDKPAPRYNRYFIVGVGLILVLVLGVGGVALVMSGFSGGSDPASGTPSTDTAAYNSALARARAFTGTNTDWEPFYWTFEDGVEMALVPAGCFMMGSADGDSDEQPVHEQCFEEPFWIDRTEVTQGQFERLGGVKANANGFNGANRPVENITWFEARNFCTLRGARLPTEREWEYAARGPANWVYPWGDTWNENNAVWAGNANGQTAEVGSRPGGASWVGALDMSGNVWEWVSTLYESYPYAAADGRENSDNRTDYRVLRGGSFDITTNFLRAPNRVRNGPDGGSDFIGVRCARSVE